MDEDGVLFVLIGVACMVLLFVIERCIHVSFVLFFSVIFPSRDDSIYPGMQAVGSIVSVWSSLILSVMSSLTQVAKSLFSMLVWWAFVFAIAAMVFMVYEEMPHVTRQVCMQWNAWLGPMIHLNIVSYMRLFKLAFEHVIPVYNAYVGFIANTFRSVFTTVLFQAGSSAIGFSESTGIIFGRLGQSFVSFVLGMHERVRGCEEMGDTCFDAVQLDLVTPFSELPKATGHLIGLFLGACPVLQPPADLLLYPFVDPNLGHIIHNIVNALIHTFIEMPRVTVQRCKLFKSEGLMMCVPDFRRSTDQFVQATVLAGTLIDNWLDMSLVIVERSFALKSVSCDVMDVRLNASLSVESFDGNVTVVSAISPSLYAITDGTTIKYYETGRAMQVIESPLGEGWPIEVDVTLGVAVVSLATGLDSEGQSTGLLGCRCDDTTGGLMQLTCAIAPHYGSTTRSMPKYVFPARFQVATTAEYMKCSTSKISVQNIRWPVTRYTSLTPEIEVLSQGRADAAVWVTPLCAIGVVNMACVPTFKYASCYPYCMALHERGTMMQNLVLFSANEWQDYVHMLGRDCTMTKVKYGLIPVTPSSQGQPETIQQDSAMTYISNGVMGSSVEEMEWDGAGCEFSPLARSLAPARRHAAYKESFNSIRMDGQPFVFAGDTALVGEYDDWNNEYFLTVYRLTGNSRSEYTLTKIKNKIPANPPLELLSDATTGSSNTAKFSGEQEGQYYQQGRFTLPYRFSGTAFANNAAVQTETHLFFATNPTLNIFKSLFDWCGPKSADYDFPQTQLMVMSKYHPLQVTRISPYGDEDDLDPQNVFFPESMSTIFLRSSGGVTCLKEFDLAITSMDYMDPMNIVITVLRTTLRNAARLQENGLEYRLVYLNPRTMQMAETPWDLPRPAQPSDLNVRLCPAMRRLPNIGSMLSELTVASIVLLRWFPEMVVGFVGMVPVWKKTGPDCPLIYHRHTQLQRCGGELLSLDEFFRALDTANRHFWRSLSFIAEFLVFPGGGSMQNVLNGMNYFGYAFLPPFMYTSQARITRVFKLPVMNQLSGMSLKMIQVKPSPLINMASSFKMMGTQSISISWYISRLINNIIMGIIPHAVRGDIGLALRGLWMDIYDSRDDLRELVFPPIYQGCAGLSIMLGYNNPWASFLRKICETSVPMAEGPMALASALLVDTAFTGCLCVNSVGDDFYDHAMTNCYNNAPRHLQPLIINWLQFKLDPGETCAEMRTLMQNNIKDSMDPLFLQLMDAAEDLGGAVDYMRIALDSDAGQCLNFDTDPFVVALIPQPVDYFRACGATTMCENRCKGEIENFDELSTMTSVRPPQAFSHRVRSLFFVNDNADSRAPFRIVLSVLQIPCTEACVGMCVAIFGINWEGSGFVRRYCVPSAPGQGVYLKSKWKVQTSSVSTWSMGRIINEDASAVVVVTTNRWGRMMVVQEDGEGSEQWLAEDVGSDVDQISHLYVHNGLILMRVLRNSGGSGHVSTLCGKCKKIVEGCSVSECPEGRENFFTESKGFTVVWIEDPDVSTDPLYSKALMFPSQASQETQGVFLMEMEGVTVSRVSNVGWAKAFAYNSGTAEIYSLLLEQESISDGNVQVLSQNCYKRDEATTFNIFSTDRPSSVANWLSNMEVDLGSGSAFRRYSQTVSIDVHVAKRCDRLSCSGCISLEVQKACYAMQQCVVGKCVGTLVNQRHPLCAVGLTIQNLFVLSIQSMQAVSSIGTDTFADVLGLGFGDMDVSVEWPEDAFFALLCTSKDAIATAVSTLTSTINNFVQTSLSMPLTYAEAGAVSVDGNMRAVMTMVFTSINNLLFQAALLPLYVPIVIQKIVVCETNSLLAFTDVFGLSVFIGDRDIQAVSQNAIGICLPEQASTDVTEMMDEGVMGKISVVAAELLSVLEHSVSNLAMSSMTTMTDAMFAWILGVIHGMGDVSQTVDMAHCKMPDFYMSDVFKCVCGDDAVEITPQRRVEGVEENAFWCSGTLEMISPSGTPVIIFNPLTLHELSLEMEAQEIDRYFLCVSRPDEFENQYPGSRVSLCDEYKPRIPVIDAQGVDAIAVWGRCKANYNVREWDPGAYAVFQEDTYFRGLTRQIRQRLVSVVGECLLESHSRGQGPTACMLEFLASPRVNMTRAMYFAYQVSTHEGSSVHTDACRVFSGPAKTGSVMFKECLDEYTEDGCQISPFVWSARSNNRVPVASEHNLRLSGMMARRRMADAMMTQAHERAMRAIESVLNYTNDNLDTYLFSVEGDFLHQLMDCAVMGAMERVDLWPTDEWSSLPVPSWWRMEDSRDIPQCGGEELDSENPPFDDSFPPFSCGSPSRRGIMKYFIRRVMGKQEGANLVVQSVREQMRRQYELWEDKSKYPCTCAGGGNDYVCCDTGDTDSFSPEGLQDGFDEIDSEIIAAVIADELSRYWKTIQTDVGPWWDEVLNTSREEWMWEDTLDIASQRGLHSTTRPLFFFNGSDVGTPFNNGTQSLWEMCTGLLSQGMSSAPLVHNSSGWFLYGIDSIVLTRGKEADFVRELRKIAGAYSPVLATRDWRHVPSASAVCFKRGRIRPIDGTIRMLSMETGTTTYTGTEAAHLGVGAFRLGSQDCFCGWYLPDARGLCEVPVEACEAAGEEFNQAIGGLCQDTRAYYEVYDASVRAIGAKFSDTQWESIPCPMLAFSDLWGIVTDKASAEWLSGENEDFGLDPRDILRFGRGGLRIGSWVNLIDRSKRHIKPSDRMRRLFDSVTGEDIVSQKDCSPVSSDKVDDHTVFPMVQIVQESMPVQACARYVVEALKHRMVVRSRGDEVLLSSVIQELSLQKWETRCMNQLHLVNTCNHFSVFEAMPPPGNSPDCPFTITGNNHYVSSGCIVFLADENTFVDPCKCMPCVGGAISEDTLRQKKSECALFVDPRTLATTWGAKIPQSFIDNLLEKFETSDEMQHEAPAAELPNELCDGIIDWWPENWTEPVGYHVTTPCHVSEAGYRVFDNTYAVERDEGEFDVVTVTVRYHHDSFRDPDMSSANFGTTGMCNQVDYGMPLFDINTVRVCTRTHEDEVFDPTVPRAPTFGEGYAAEKCASSSKDVPWIPLSDSSAAERAVGMLPLWDGEEGSTMPRAGSNRAFVAGVSRETMPPFWTNPGCVTSDDCLSSGSLELTCLNGVCVDGDVQCTKHSDCTLVDAGTICDGIGMCVVSEVTVYNAAGVDAQIELYADECGSELTAKEALGTSQWGKINKVLDAHGLCGYHQWYDYTTQLRKLCGNDVCPRAELSWDTDWSISSTLVEWDTVGQGVFAYKDTGYLKMIPHQCDRDFGNARQTMCLSGAGEVAESFQTFSVYGTTSIGRLPKAVDSPRLGFLGVPQDIWDAADFRRCDSIMQCAVHPFTWNLVEYPRKISSTVPYEKNDIFKCGASMYFDIADNKCKVDADVVPFYTPLCVTRGSTYDKCKSVLNEGFLDIQCTAFLQSYEPREKVLNVEHNKIFESFIPFEANFGQYIEYVKCAEALAGDLPTSGGKYAGQDKLYSVYYAFPYSLYEVPFAWWFKCAIMNYQKSSMSHHGNVDCDGWARASTRFPYYNVDNWHDALMYINKVPPVENLETDEIDEQVNGKKGAFMDVINDLDHAPAETFPMARECESEIRFMYSQEIRDGGAFACINSRQFDNPSCREVAVPGDMVVDSSSVSIMEAALNAVVGYAKTGDMDKVPYFSYETSPGMLQDDFQYPAHELVINTLQEYDWNAFFGEAYGDGGTCPITDLSNRDIYIDYLSDRTPLYTRDAFSEEKQAFEDMFQDGSSYGSQAKLAHMSSRDTFILGGDYIWETSTGSSRDFIQIEGLTGVTCYASEEVYDLWSEYYMDRMPYTTYAFASLRNESYGQRLMFPANAECAIGVFFTMTFWELLELCSYLVTQSSGKYLMEEWDHFTPVHDTRQLNDVVKDAQFWEHYCDTNLATQTTVSSCYIGVIGGVIPSHISSKLKLVPRLQVDSTICTGASLYCKYPSSASWVEHMHFDRTKRESISYWMPGRSLQGDCSSENGGECLREASQYIQYVYEKRVKHSVQDFFVYAEMRESIIFQKPEHQDSLKRYNAYTYDASENYRHDDYLLRGEDGSEVMCLESSKYGGYTDCNMDENVQAIHEHINASYKVDVFDIVKVGEAVMFRGLPLSSSSLEPVIVAWGAVGHEGHVTKLVDGSICESGELLNNVCYGEDVIPVNPWVGGSFNVFVGCDTVRNSVLGREEVDGSCNQYVCGEDTLFFQHLSSPECLLDGENIRGGLRNTDRAANNLCNAAKVSVSNAECAHDQGLLGGSKGKPVSDLYQLSDFQCANSTLQMFKDGVAPLFRGEDIENGCLALHPEELGVCRVNLEISEDKVLRIVATRIRCLAEDDPVTVNKTRQWVSTLEEALAEDERRYNAVYSGTPDREADWSDPLQRVAFWTSAHKHARPLLPDPSRNRILFKRLGVTDTGHPSQAANDLWEPDNYYTTNGYCFCDEPANCRVTSASHPCSVTDSINAMLRNEWRDSVIMGAKDEITSFDWPRAPGRLRDGSSTLNSEENPRGRVLDRVPPSQMRYSGDHPITNGPQGLDSSSPGGNCHMGRGSRTTPSQTTKLSKCKMVGRNSSYTTLRCGDNDETMYLPLEKSKTPDWYIDIMKERRRKCSECSIPSFDPDHFDEAEVSFGQPYRLSPVRQWMRSLTSSLLDMNDTEHPITKLDPVSREDRVSFIRDHMRDVSEGLGSTPEVLDPDLVAAFDTEWLMCFYNNSRGCKGTIPYKTWKEAPDRIQLCVERLNDLDLATDLVVPLELCDIDRQLDSVCSDLQESSYQIAEANCIATGMCEPGGYFYSPSVFSVSNNDFVRKTVERFYEMHNHTVCPVDSDTEDLRQQNNRLTETCASSYVQKLQEVIESLRTVAHTLARITMYTVNLVMNIFRLLINIVDFSGVLEDIAYWFGKIIDEMMELLVQIGNMIFRLLFEMSSWGSHMETLIKWMCEAVKIVLVVVRALYCTITRPLLGLFIDGIKEVVSAVQSAVNALCFQTCDFELTGVNTILDKVRELAVDKTQNFCENGLDFACSSFSDELEDDGDGTNMVPTRCWADFVPTVGMSTQLSCTRSDTCLLEAFSNDKVVCDACPEQEVGGVGAFNQYGCDLLTKQCQCKTQFRSITYCSQHDQCSGDASCLMVDDIFSSASWGVDTCSNCRTTSLCIFDGSERLGRCGCPFREPVFESCREDAIGSMPFFQANKDCLYTFSDIQGGGSDYMTFASLMAVPCAIVKPVKVVCVQVAFHTVTYTRVVGYELQTGLSGVSFSRRRLMSVEDEENLPLSRYELIASLLLNHADWNHTADPCRSLVMMHRHQAYLSPLDDQQLERCVFWRTVGHSTPRIPDTMFLSWEDFFNAFSQNSTSVMQVPYVARDIVIVIIEAWPEAQRTMNALIPLLVRNSSWVDALKKTSVWIERNRGSSLSYAQQFSLFHPHELKGRRLLQLNDDEEAVPYAVYSSAAVMRELGADEDFLKSPRFSRGDTVPVLTEDRFPLPYDYWIDADGDGNLDADTCPVASIILDEMSESVRLLERYYTEGFYRLPKVNRTFSQVLPLIREVSTRDGPIEREATMATSFYDVFKTLLSGVGATSGRIAFFLSCTDDREDTTMCNIITDMLRCDIESVQLCSRHTRDLILSGIFFVGIFWLLDMVLAYMSITAGRLYLWLLLFPIIVMWWAYGYSPSCWPMVPTCLLEDLMSYVYIFFPKEMHVPLDLQTSFNCWNNTAIPAVDCFKSCSSSPEFNYQSLSATVAWLACETLGPQCSDLKLPLYIPGVLESAQFQKDLAHKARAFQLMEQEDYWDAVTAQRVCLSAGLVVSLPYLLLIIICVYVLVSMLLVPFQLIYSFLQLALQLVFFTHIRAGSDI